MDRVAALAVLLQVLPVAASAENLVGRWCDRPEGGEALAVIAIVHLDNDAFEARVDYADGSHAVRALDGPYEFSFPVHDSPTGEVYIRDDAGSGTLNLQDNAGLIRVARPLPDLASPGDCLKGG